MNYWASFTSCSTCVGWWGCVHLKSVYTPTLIDSTVHLPRNVTTHWQHLGSTDRSTCDSPSFCLSQLSGHTPLLLWCVLCYLLSTNFSKRTRGLTFYQLHHQKSMNGLYLPYSYYSVGNEDEEDDKGFDKGCDRSFPFFKPCKCLQRQTEEKTGRKLLLYGFTDREKLSTSSVYKTGQAHLACWVKYKKKSLDLIHTHF